MTLPEATPDRETLGRRTEAVKRAVSGLAIRLREWFRRGASAAVLAALALSLASAAGAGWTSVHIFERLPHLEDEFAYLWQGEIMAEGKAWLPSPPEPRSFLVPFVVDHEGRRFGKYTPGWPAAIALAIEAGDPWLLNPILAGISIWLLFRLGTKVAGPGIGVLAAALAASSPFLYVLAGTLMPHVFSLFLTLAIALAWLDLFPGPSRSESSLPPAMLVAVAGLSLGLLALTRPLTAVGVAVPFAIHGGLILLRGRRPARLRLMAVALLALGVTALLPLWNAAVAGDPWVNPYTLWWDYDRIGFGLGFGRTTTGHSLALARLNLRVSLRVGQHDLFGWPFLSWIFLPFGALALRRARDAWLIAGLIPGLIVAYGFYWIGTWLFGPRYYFEALPAAAILTAAGIAWLGGWGDAGPGRWKRLRRSATAAVVLVLVALNGAFYLPMRLQSLRGLYGVSGVRRDTFASAVPANAFVIVHPVESWTDYGTLLTLEPPFCECDRILAYSRGPRVDARAAAAYPDMDVYHYYPDDPGVFWVEARR